MDFFFVVAGDDIFEGLDGRSNKNQLSTSFFSFIYICSFLFLVYIIYMVISYLFHINYFSHFIRALHFYRSIEHLAACIIQLLLTIYIYIYMHMMEIGDVSSSCISRFHEREWKERTKGHHFHHDYRVVYVESTSDFLCILVDKLTMHSNTHARGLISLFHLIVMRSLL